MILNFNRNFNKILDNWVGRQYRKPLIVRGARQVGKSFSVRTFGMKTFANYFEFNFERERSLKKIFEGDLKPKEILASLEASLGKAIPKEESIIFFDEIQNCPNAILALRYFCEEMPQLPIIAAGSLLEFALSKISIPVGRVEYAYLYPMTFREFLEATHREKLTEHIPKVHIQGNSFPKENSTVSDILRKAFEEYIVIGGMPASIATFSSTHSFEEVKQTQDSILQSFLDDTVKYAQGDLQLANLERLIKNVFRHVGHEVTYSTLVPDEEYRRSKKSLDLLEKAALVHKVRACNPSGLPLAAEASDKHFKVLFLDVGLGGRMVGIHTNDFFQGNNILSAFEGRIAEQVVGQELIANGAYDLNAREIHCWIRLKANAKAEVDYVVSRNEAIIPIEVKAGKYGRLRSLHQLFKQYPSIKRGICLQDRGDICLDKDIIFAPLYAQV